MASRLKFKGAILWSITVWQCTKCCEAIEETFDTCWNCGTSVAGVEDPAFEPVGPGAVEPEPPVIQPDEPHVRVTETFVSKCAYCGSDDLIRSVTLSEP